MRYYSVVLFEYKIPKYTYAGKEPFISTSREAAERQLLFCQENWPNETYQIVWFDL